MDSATGCRKLNTLLRNFGYMSLTCPALFSNVFNQASICIQLSVLKINTLYRFLHTIVYCQPNLKARQMILYPKVPHSAGLATRWKLEEVFGTLQKEQGFWSWWIMGGGGKHIGEGASVNNVGFQFISPYPEVNISRYYLCV